jgi:hypothetical protein
MVGAQRTDDWLAVAGALVADARLRAGLTQAELANRAGTVQSAIAAYEAGRRQPTLPTLYRLLAAAGFDLRARLEAHDPHDETLEEWEASLDPAEAARWRAKLASQQRRAATWAAS